MILHIAAIGCDGCGAIYQARPDGPSSAAQIRREAVVVGWVNPPKIKTNGEPGASFSDVCPKCAPDWQHRTAPNTWNPSTHNRIYQAIDPPDPHGDPVTDRLLTRLRDRLGPRLNELLREIIAEGEPRVDA